MNFAVIVKCVPEGLAGVGKSSILRRLVYNEFNEGNFVTIGADFYVKSISFEDYNIKYQFFDLGGCVPRSNEIISYFRGSRIILLIFSIDDRESFENITQRFYFILCHI